MTEQELVERFREIGFLQGISQDHLERLAEVAKSVEFPEAKVIFRQGEPASHIFVVVGSIRRISCHS